MLNEEPIVRQIRTLDDDFKNLQRVEGLKGFVVFWHYSSSYRQNFDYKSWQTGQSIVSHNVEKDFKIIFNFNSFSSIG